MRVPGQQNTRPATWTERVFRTGDEPLQDPGVRLARGDLLKVPAVRTAGRYSRRAGKSSREAGRG